MKIRLPEKKFFTVADLAKRWEVGESDVLHLIEIGEIQKADKFAALHGKRKTKFIASFENPYVKLPELMPDDLPTGVREIELEGGYIVQFGFQSETDEFHVWGYMPIAEDRTENECTADVALMRNFFTDAQISVVLLEDVLSFEAKYAEDNRHDAAAKELEKNGPFLSQNLALVNQAAHRFWDNAIKGDPTTHPNNSDVVAWLIDRGLTKSVAERAATIIRPEWAHVGRKPDF